MLMWTPKMYHMRTQRRHVKYTINTPYLEPEEKKSTDTEPLILDNIQHKRHFPNIMTSNGLRAYFGHV